MNEAEKYASEAGAGLLVSVVSAALFAGMFKLGEYVEQRCRYAPVQADEKTRLTESISVRVTNDEFIKGQQYHSVVVGTGSPIHAGHRAIRPPLSAKPKHGQICGGLIGEFIAAHVANKKVDHYSCLAGTLRKQYENLPDKQYLAILKVDGYPYNAIPEEIISQQLKKPMPVESIAIPQPQLNDFTPPSRASSSLFDGGNLTPQTPPVSGMLPI
jgi:hypothetical protein